MKNAKRIANIKLNTSQKNRIKVNLKKVSTDPLNKHNIHNRWQDEFLQILNKRHEKDFIETISEHIATYQNLVNTDNPEYYENNQRIFVKSVSQIITSLDEKQKRSLLSRIKATIETLISISKD